MARSYLADREWQIIEVLLSCRTGGTPSPRMIISNIYAACCTFLGYHWHDWHERLVMILECGFSRRFLLACLRAKPLVTSELGGHGDLLDFVPASRPKGHQ